MIEALMDAYVERVEHEANHKGVNVDLIHCSHCQDEYMAWDSNRIVWSNHTEPEAIVWSNTEAPGQDDWYPSNVDRLEDLEI